MSDRPIVKPAPTVEALWAAASQGNENARWLLETLLDGWDERVREWERLAPETLSEPTPLDRARAGASTALTGLRHGKPMSQTMFRHIINAQREGTAIEILMEQGRIDDWKRAVHAANKMKDRTA